ncbi:hypothetical protein M440DRAFT_319602 [Trichoderma longibrachiatum ATCC 18648]|uniref:Uncharacterized protein n=1 Tax=Trichoderma longibrachiatum ATCC 18648 TaxID=983965 RepID=A0A2T4C482_TRILO|nr:hypothetical protein M440DRAFT_319602 [Trichoderma longibrachiatum ATCC 18648]
MGPNPYPSQANKACSCCPKPAPRRGEFEVEHNLALPSSSIPISKSWDARRRLEQRSHPSRPGVLEVTMAQPLLPKSPSTPRNSRHPHSSQAFPRPFVCTRCMSFWHVPGPNNDNPHRSKAKSSAPGKSPVPSQSAPRDPSPTNVKRGPPSNRRSRRCFFPRRSATVRGSGRPDGVGGLCRGETGGPPALEARSLPSISIAITFCRARSVDACRWEGDALAGFFFFVEREGRRKCSGEEAPGPPCHTTPRRSLAVLCNIPDPRQNRDGSKVGIASLSEHIVAAGALMAPFRAQQV